MKAPRRTPNRHAAGAALRPARRRRPVLWAVVALIAIGALTMILVLRHAAYTESGMAKRWIHRLAALTAIPAAGSHAASAHAALPVPPTTIGINLSSPAYYRQARAFANLALGSSWASRIPGHPNLGPDEIDKDGNLKQLPGGQPVWRMLTLPNASARGIDIRCTYEGHGDIRPTMAAAQNVRPSAGGFTFHWTYTGYKTSLVILRVGAIDAKDPIRNIDCREADLPRTARFDPQFVAWVRHFKAIRFMDWQNTNAAKPIIWGQRHTSASLDILDQDGVSVEDMVDLSTQAGADPWFNMPWNADEDYVRRFAQYVHDHLPRDRKVYVEAGNEVWNTHFPMSKQALAEGQAEGLSSDPEKGRLFRYAERLVQIMTPWEQVFVDRPGQLVRVANCQNGPNRSNMVLAYKDTANHVDALATAPYFGGDFHKTPPADVDAAFARLDSAMDEAFATTLKAKAVAAKYNKRYIAYEAGQHIILEDVALAGQIQRDPRMYDAYKRYLDFWRANMGDTIMMYDSVQPIVRTGSWGLVEYFGQPVSEAPKWRAVLEETQKSHE
jgi:hypothetical protein